jgi:xylulokinase
MNCTVAIEEFREFFNIDLKTLEAEAAKSPIGANGIVMLPFFNGERTPNLPNGRASICGITQGNFERENLLRASLESAIFGMKIGLERFTSLGYKAKEIRLAGGGSKNPLWQNMAANIMNLPVRVPKNTEAAALGAAIQGLWCFLNNNNPQGESNAKKVSIKTLTDEHVAFDSAETIKPDKKAASEYSKAYANYLKYLEVLAPLYK